jgi:hypothetical protein
MGGLERFSVTTSMVPAEVVPRSVEVEVGVLRVERLV